MEQGTARSEVPAQAGSPDSRNSRQPSEPPTHEVEKLQSQDTGEREKREGKAPEEEERNARRGRRPAEETAATHAAHEEQHTPRTQGFGKGDARRTTANHDGRRGAHRDLAGQRDSGGSGLERGRRRRGGGKKLTAGGRNDYSHGVKKGGGQASQNRSAARARDLRRDFRLTSELPTLAGTPDASQNSRLWAQPATTSELPTHVGTSDTGKPKNFRI